jgi:hypothetical protein
MKNQTTNEIALKEAYFKQLIYAGFSEEQAVEYMELTFNN